MPSRPNTSGYEVLATAEPLLKEEEQELASLASQRSSLEDNHSRNQPCTNQSSSHESSRDPFEPFDDLPDENGNILSIRALAVGIFCGALVNASNIYLGLKSGWTTSANIFGSIVGFTVLKLCAKYFPHMPVLGGSFGPRENNIVQTAATAAGGMSGVFVSAFPAIYQLGLLDSPQRDFWRITTLTAVGGYFGLFFATPLRKFFIILVARELRLIFPSASATSFTIRSMHLALEGADAARRKMRALALAFIFAMVLRVLSQYALGILWDWHPFTWLHIWSDYSSPMAMSLESWGWYVELTPAFIGSGMLVGLNVALSYLFGSVLAWGIIGPFLVAKGMAFGLPASDDPMWEGYVSYFSLSDEFTTADHPSPRYWLLWPGVLGMIAVSFTELACQWRILYLTGKAVYRTLQAYFSLCPPSRTDHNASGKQLISDPALPSERIKTWMWLPGLIAVLVLTCLIMRFQYGMPIGQTLLALFLAFFFSFLAIQATGATDITPLTAASKASQIILGSASKGHSWTIQRAQRMNLLGGALASLGANQASDLTTDFRVGFLLRTSPRKQYLAQFLGTFVAIFLAPSTYVLFSTAYPCINDLALSSHSPSSPKSQECAFAAPSVSAWRAVAVAVTSTSPTLPIPTSSKIFSLVFAAAGCATVVLRHAILTGPREKYSAWVPNAMVVALAFVVPASVYGTAMVIGAIVAEIWGRWDGKGFGMFGMAVAAGFMAGEGIGGVVNAGLEIMGLGGRIYGLGIGCPGGRCP